MPSLRASEQGKEIIERARNLKGWTVSDPAFLVAASNLLEPETEWYESGPFATGISESTLNRFLRGEPIRPKVFKACCAVLGLNWEDVVERAIATTRHNLDGCVCEPSQFVGRQRELNKLLELLSWDNPTRHICIEGIGGAGKTTLVLRAARLCLRQSQATREAYAVPAFDAIIFVSAKEEDLTPDGILPCLMVQSTLRDIFGAIARTLNCRDLIQAEFQEQIEGVQLSLGQQQTLLIVDNLESAADRAQVLSFLQKLPPTVKLVVTTREQVGGTRIYLEELPETDALHLIQHQARAKETILSVEECQQLYQKIGGLPIAINCIVGQIVGKPLPLEDILAQIPSTSLDIARFCLESSVQCLRGKPSHRLLMALTLFPQPALGEAIAEVAGLRDRAEMLDGISQLARHSLIQSIQQHHHYRYSLLPIVCTYVLEELRANPNCQQEAWERWLSWCKTLSEDYGKKDWREWQESCEQLGRDWDNLRSGLDGCIQKAKYDDFKEIWRNVKDYSHFCEDRDKHLQWLAWLREKAEERDDKPVLLEALYRRGLALIWTAKPTSLEEADELLARAWQLHQEREPDFQLGLAIAIALLHLKQHRPEAANQQLNLCQHLLEDTEISEANRQRQQFALLYYRGEAAFRTGDFEQAKSWFEEAFQQAQALGWRRAISLAQNWLGEIAIEQNNCAEAERLLSDGLQVAESSGDKRRIAFYHHTFCKLEKARGNREKAYFYGEKAIAEFGSLGMSAKVEEIEALLESIN